MKTKMIFTSLASAVIALSALQSVEARSCQTGLVGQIIQADQEANAGSLSAAAATTTTLAASSLPATTPAAVLATTAAAAPAATPTATPAYLSSTYDAETADSLKSTHQKGTSDLQQKVLMKINQHLVDGWISPAVASQLKSQLNNVNASESWYRSFNEPIPASLIEKNNQALAEMSKAMVSKQKVSVASDNALHEDVDQLISRNLAGNHISSSQAEKYYQRLAEIESNLESAKSNNESSVDQSKAFSKTLDQIKSELSGKSH